jgi:hypothetical protein
MLSNMSSPEPRKPIHQAIHIERSGMVAIVGRISLV